jgi:hypothetical protein
MKIAVQEQQALALLSDGCRTIYLRLRARALEYQDRPATREWQLDGKVVLGDVDREQPAFLQWADYRKQFGPIARRVDNAAGGNDGEQIVNAAVAEHDFPPGCDVAPKGSTSGGGAPL